MSQQLALEALVGSTVLSVEAKGKHSTYEFEITTTDGEKITIGTRCGGDVYMEFTDQDGNQPG